MAKIDFQHFKVANGIAQKDFVTMDFRENLGNRLYKEKGGIAYLDLAMKVYKSEGETEYDEKEVKMLGDYIASSTLNCSVLDAFNKIVKEQEQEQKKDE